MPSKKRSLDEEQPPKSKKIRVNNEEAPAVSNLFSTEIDFPRGGGTSLTPLEYRNVRAEAIREADAEVVFAVCFFMMMFEQHIETFTFYKELGREEGQETETWNRHRPCQGSKIQVSQKG